MMKMLTYSKELWQNVSLEDVCVIGCQHLMESTFEMLKELKRAGLSFSNVFLLGKCYSSCNEIVEEMRIAGIYVSDHSVEFDSHLSYDEYFQKRILEFLIKISKKIKTKHIRKLIILDDGGNLLHAIHTNNLFNLPIAGVEQTSSGSHKLSKLIPTFPIVNVGRASAKLLLETPFIVDSCIERLSKWITTFENKRILIMGSGAIGQGVAERLGECDLSVFDPKIPERAKKPNLKTYDLILGCSGKTSLSFEDYAYLKKGVILASFSSSDREFDAVHFRRFFPQTNCCHMNYSYGGITLLESGFPINFYGSRNNMPLENIQITLSLLITAIFQATSLTEKQTGLLSIDNQKEKAIMGKFQEIYKLLAI